LVQHLQGIAAKEAITAEPEALGLIARAAEGSVRDALSLFDQAIAHAAGPVRAEDVRQMLGLADRTKIIDLFEALMRADLAGALSEVREQYDAGADPAMVLGDLAEFTHFVTRVKVVPALADDVSLTEAERTRGRAFAAKLSMRVLARTWQMLLKGLEEVAAAGRPLAAAEMVLVRIAYAADLPTPDEVIRSLGEPSRGNGAAAAAPAGQSAARADAPPRAETPRFETPRTDSPRGGTRAALAAAAAAELPVNAPMARSEETPAVARTLASLEELVALAVERRDLALKSALERDVRLVRFEDGRIEFSLEPSAQKSLTGELSKKLADWTGRRWMVIVSAEQGQPSLYAQAQARKAELKDGVRGDPLVQAVLNRFPGAEIVDVRTPAGAAEQLPLAGEDAGDPADEEQ
jgi:DNA polymerase-3 subunit gamma/tau